MLVGCMFCGGVIELYAFVTIVVPAGCAAITRLLHSHNHAKKSKAKKEITARCVGGCACHAERKPTMAKP